MVYKWELDLSFEYPDVFNFTSFGNCGQKCKKDCLLFSLNLFAFA